MNFDPSLMLPLVFLLGGLVLLFVSRNARPGVALGISALALLVVVLPLVGLYMTGVIQ